VLPVRELKKGMQFKVEVIDTWNMTITPVAGVFEIGDLTRYTAADRLKRVVALPGKPYIALRIQRVGQAGKAGPSGRVEDEL
jgi:hypothetical protein